MSPEAVRQPASGAVSSAEDSSSSASRPVERLAGVGEDLLGAGDLPGRADLGDLGAGAHDLPEPVAQLHRATVGVVDQLVPRGAPAVRLDLGGRSAAGVGQGEDPPPVGLGRGDQALVGEHLQRGVDRPRAGSPHTTAALGELGDDLVAVHRLLGEQPQDRQPYVSATRSWSATATTAAVPATSASAAEPRPEGRAGRRVEALGRSAVPAATPVGSVGQLRLVCGRSPGSALAAVAVRAEGAELGAGEEESVAVSVTVPAPAAARGAPVGVVAGEGVRTLGAIGGAGVGRRGGSGEVLRGST